LAGGGRKQASCEKLSDYSLRKKKKESPDVSRKTARPKKKGPSLRRKGALLLRMEFVGCRTEKRKKRIYPKEEGMPGVGGRGSQFMG